MKLLTAFSLALFNVPTATTASYTPPSSNYYRCLTDTEASAISTALANGETIDLFPSKAQSDQSSYWEVEYHGTYKILRNTQPDVNTTYLLYQCGLDAPVVEEKVDGIFHVPFTGGLVVTDTTQIPFIEILNRRSQIVAFAVPENLISSPCLVEDIIPAGKEDGTITFLPLYNDTALDSFLKEHNRTLAFGGPWDENLTMKNKVIISSVAESPALAAEQGRDVNQAIFEWLEVYGAFFNEEHLANETVEETRARYDCHTENAMIVAEERRREMLEEDKSRLPLVLWAYHMQDYNGTDIGWDVGECPNYYCTYASNCMVNILNSTEGSVDYYGYTYMSDDEFLEFGKDADVWIYPSSNWNSLVTQKADYLSDFKSVQNMEVYDYQLSGESAWFEQRMAEYDNVLLDFCEVAKRDIDPTHGRKWFRNVYIEGVGSLGACSDPDEPYMPRVTECLKLEENGGGADSYSSSGYTSLGKTLVAWLLMSLVSISVLW
ncbi:hypothetical protein HJC23_010863 [Cyclotella cryptica]|uniref:Uncharacterized protein n=1 Tax=Cyclotella cryptica TaxID=29204 RepID=A0ABD3QNV9_9STRA|eukprot:CCRYP_003620-RA/>CCRYP_003620-RA protein AED:0.07 eAED:0.07 QI:0/0.66/0.5/1/0.66/0.5/4/261/490